LPTLCQPPLARRRLVLKGARLGEQVEAGVDLPITKHLKMLMQVKLLALTPGP